LAAAGANAAVVVPIGFVSDHMEVKFDLDTEAAATASSLGLSYARAATPGTDHRFVSMITDLVCERLEGRAGLDSCAAGCCLIENRA
jgi:protoporphyrin/coproporphyrin ferrochelatase